MKLFIDDIREPVEDDWIIMRTYGDAIHWMRTNGCPSVMSFDHDLGEAHELTGYDIAKWIVEKDLNANGSFIPSEFKFFVHSANPVGAENIRTLLNNYLRHRC